MWKPCDDLGAFNQSLVELEQKLLAVYRHTLSLESLVSEDILQRVWYYVDQSPYHAVLMSGIKSSHAMTPRHAINVMLLARAWTLTKHKLGNLLDDFSIAALFHDLGHWDDPSLVYVFDHFSHDQFEQMKKHPILNEPFLEQRNKKIVKWIGQHHEQPNGGGYPTGLKGEEIDSLSQALRIVDCFDGLTTARRFRPRYSPMEALVLMTRWSGKRLSRGLYSSFKNFLCEIPVGTFVTLKDGARAISLGPSDSGIHLLSLTDVDGDPLETPAFLSLPLSEIMGEAPSWHRPTLPKQWQFLRPDLMDLPRGF